MKIRESAIEAGALALHNAHYPDEEIDRGSGEWEVVLMNARTVLEAASPHLRQKVTTLDELRALPGGAVVIDAIGAVVQRHPSGSDDWYGECWHHSTYIYLPATVLWEPEQPDGDQT